MDDPIGASSYADPYPRYAELRASSPVLWFEPAATWYFFRHADVSAILRSRAFGTLPGVHPEVDQAMPAFRDLKDGGLLLVDPPEHTRLRAVVNPWFWRRRLEEFRPLVREIVTRRLETVGPEFDFVTALAAEVPPNVLAAALGIASEDVHLLGPWITALLRYWELHHEPGTVAAAETAAAEMGRYVQRLVTHRHTHPGDDVISHLIQAGLSDHETVVMAALLLTAGHETTVHLLGNAVLALLRDEEAWRALAGDPSIAPVATEELLRYDTSIQTFPRRVLERTEVSGATLEPGATVRVVFGSANRDEQVFEEPDRLLLDRRGNPHFSFGVGIHTCLGAPLARIEIAEALRTLAELRPRLELGGEPARLPGLQIRGLQSLPVRDPSER